MLRAEDASMAVGARRGKPHLSLHSAPESAPRTSPAVPAGLTAVRLTALDVERRSAQIVVAGETVTATLDDALSSRVVATALARGERVIAQREATGWVVLGSLRTSDTPGVDEGEEFVIKAKRVLVSAEHEFAVVSGAASLVLRAHGAIETLAKDITSRASSLHKIVGRLIRLN
jgi:hypothetical protein